MKNLDPPLEIIIPYAMEPPPPPPVNGEKVEHNFNLLSQFRHTSFLYDYLYIRFSYESYIILICKPEYMIFICAVSYEFYIIRFI